MKLIVLTISSVLVICFFAVAVLDSPRPAMPVDVDIPRQYWPGQRSTAGATCQNDYAAGGIIEACHAGDVLIEYDPQSGAITSAYRELSETGVTIGDLIVAYGTPVAALYDGGSGVLYFGSGARASYWLRAGRAFGPKTPAFFLYRTTANSQEKLDTWRGFIVTIR